MYPMACQTKQFIQHDLKVAFLTSFAVLLLCAALGYSNRSTAEVIVPNTPFYYQLHQFKSGNIQADQSSLLNKISLDTNTFNAIPMTRNQEDDLAFNYLWMQQYQQDYEYKDGGAAIGKLLRMGLKSMYRRNNASLSSENDFSSSYSSFDYHLRLSGNKFKIGLEYDF